VVALVALSPATRLFVGAMLLGMLLHTVTSKNRLLILAPPRRYVPDASGSRPGHRKRQMTCHPVFTAMAACVPDRARIERRSWGTRSPCLTKKLRGIIQQARMADGPALST
jgi:hypothetical protein